MAIDTTHDIVPDSPTNVFATFNPLDPMVGSPTFLDGNLSFSAGTTYQHANANFFVKQGKWYFEMHVTTELSSQKLAMLGFREKINTNEFYYRNDGLMYDGSNSSGNPTFNQSDVIGCYLNLDDNNGEITFYKNGSVINGSPFATNILSNLTNKGFFPFLIFYDATGYVNFGQDHTFGGYPNSLASSSGYSDAKGIGSFYYDPPTGALALCTANLPDPAIDPNVDDLPEDYMKAVTYTGSNSQTTLDFETFTPDLLWIKNRTGGSISHSLIDTVRGETKILASDLTDQEATIANLSTFNPNNTVTLLGGYSRVNDVTNSRTYIAWGWRAAGSPADGQAKIINEDGSDGTMSTADLKTSTGATITPSKVSANRKSGFSIIRYNTGQTTNDTSGNVLHTIPHGLSAAPEMIICKSTNVTYNWYVYHISAGATSYLSLNAGTNSNTNSNLFNGPHTNSVIKIGGLEVIAVSEQLMYCWHSVSGYSKFGSYVGNGSPDGPFVYTGFKPAWVMIKKTDGAASWWIVDAVRDEYNPTKKYLLADTAGIESNGSDYITADFLSNGFKIRNTSTSFNSGTHIYAAFAEQPTKYATAR